MNKIIVQIANNSCELMIDKDYLAKKPLRRYGLEISTSLIASNNGGRVIDEEDELGVSFLNFFQVIHDFYITGQWFMEWLMNIFLDRNARSFTIQTLVFVSFPSWPQPLPLHISIADTATAPTTTATSAVSFRLRNCAVSETEKKDKDIGGKRGATVLSGGDKNDKLPSATLSVQQYLSRSRLNGTKMERKICKIKKGC
ncbi:hypothetical protein P8452_66524 [Trifolium repens]|nr:hypothetical protein P8452_66524 [Trifolium repens]